MTTQEPFIPPTTTSTTTTSTTTTTACTGTIVSNPMSLNAYKGIGISVPAFTYQVTAGNRNKIRATGFRIKDLPLPEDGVLYLNNVAVADEQVISILDNGKLIYVPVVEADAAASFNFLTETNCGVSANAAVSIAVTAKPVDDDCNCDETP